MQFSSWLMAFALVLLILATTTDATLRPTTKRPTLRPTIGTPSSKLPTTFPTKRPTTAYPTKKPTSAAISKLPTRFPSKRPTRLPTKRPATSAPSSKDILTRGPTRLPTSRPLSQSPSSAPTTNTGLLSREVARLLGSGNVDNTGFGTGCGLSSNGVAVIGAPAAANGRGGVFVFRKDHEWVQFGPVLFYNSTDSDGGGPQTGTSLDVSTDGTVIMSGAPAYHDNKYGAAIFFTLNAGKTAYTSQLYVPSLTYYAVAGEAVALSGSGNFAFVSASGEQPVPAVYIAKRTNGVFATTQMISLSLASPWMGLQLSLNNDGAYALIGAPDESEGTAYIYLRSSTTGVYALQKKFSRTSDLFGSTVALDGAGATAVICAEWAAPSTCFVFTRSGTAWTQTSALIATNEYPYGFGAHVRFLSDGSALAIGSVGDVTGDSMGAVYVFRGVNGIFNQDGPVRRGSMNNISETYPEQGTCVALTTDTLLFTGIGQEVYSTAWVFE